MGKILFLVLLGVLGWYCQTNGILYSLMHNMEPEPGRHCEIVGPIKEGVYFALAKEDLRFAIDAQIGTTGQKLDARVLLAKAMRQEKIYQVPDHTKISVLKNSQIKLYSVPYHVVEVSITEGEAKGAEGWVQRGDVIDTPLQEFYQSMRGTSRKDPNSKPKLQGGDSDPGTADPF